MVCVCGREIPLRSVLLRFAHAFDDVQHFDGGLEGGFYLVHLQTARFDDVAIVVPSDVGHHQRVGAAVGWNAHRVVGESRHFSFQVVFVNFLHRFDKRVELAIAKCALLVFLAFDFEFHRWGAIRAT